MSANFEAKKELVSEIKDKIQRAKSFVVVDYRGMTVAQDTELRAGFRNANAEYKVYKNRLVQRALSELGIAGFDDFLQGTSAIAFGFEDELAPAKLVSAAGAKTQKLEIKCGLLNGSFISADEVKALASIPSREELIGKLLFLLQSPMRGLAISLSKVAEKNA